MFDVLFDAVTLHHNISMCGGYLWIFSKEDLAYDFFTTIIIIIIFFFRFLVFDQNRPQNNDDDVLEWWKGQKKITVYNHGIFYLMV